MKVKWISDTSCQMCLDTFPEQAGTDCKNCIDARTHVGELVSTHVGFWGEYAIVTDGKSFKKVPLGNIQKVEGCS